MQVAGRGPVSAVSASAALQRAQQSIAMLRGIVRDAKLRGGGPQKLLLTHYDREDVTLKAPCCAKFTLPVNSSPKSPIG